MESASLPTVRGMGALLSSDDYGSSVERDESLHPLWRCLESGLVLCLRRVPLYGVCGRCWLAFEPFGVVGRRYERMAESTGGRSSSAMAMARRRRG
jgi:hypothetical protein